MSGRRVGILGLGTALPPNAIPTDAYIAHAKQFSCSTNRQEKVLEELYRRTAIQRRGSVLANAGYGDRAQAVFAPPASTTDFGPSTGHRMRYYAAEIPALATQACRNALFAADIQETNTVSHLVTASCTGFHAPGFDVALIEQLPLSLSTMRTHVGFMGCHGGMNALRVATAYAAADPAATILVCAAEACSLHFQYGWGPDRLVANSLFSDGAAAFVVRADSAASELEMVASGSCIVPGTAEHMQWRIGDHGFEMHLSTQVPAVIEESLPGWLDNWLAQEGYSVADIAHWAVHPGGPKILDAVESCLDLHCDALSLSRRILSECGNMSSPTVFFILAELLATKATGPCLMLGFGPGLTIEAALLQL